MSDIKIPKKKPIVQLSAELQPALQDGWFVLRSPYSAPLVDGLKQRIPSAGRSYEPASKIWKIAEAYRPMVKILLDEAQIQAVELPKVFTEPIATPVSTVTVSVPWTEEQRAENFRAAGLEEAIKPPKPPVIPEDGISAWVYAFETLSIPERMLAYQNLSKALSERNEGWPTIYAAWTRLTAE